jgi:hypothetical protein
MLVTEDQEEESSQEIKQKLKIKHSNQVIESASENSSQAGVEIDNLD